MTVSTRLIIRLVDSEGTLLGWGFQNTKAPGDGTLVPDGLCGGVGEANGVATRIIVHWPDLNMQVSGEIPATALAEGKAFAFAWSGPMLRLDNPLDHPPLAPVTVREGVFVNIPVAQLGLKGHA